jgi:hypothetical protein
MTFGCMTASVLSTRRPPLLWHSGGMDRTFVCNKEDSAGGKPVLVNLLDFHDDHVTYKAISGGQAGEPFLIPLASLRYAAITSFFKLKRTEPIPHFTGRIRSIPNGEEMVGENTQVNLDSPFRDSRHSEGEVPIVLTI